MRRQIYIHNAAQAQPRTRQTIQQILAAHVWTGTEREVFKKRFRSILVRLLARGSVLRLHRRPNGRWITEFPLKIQTDESTFFHSVKSKWDRSVQSSIRGIWFPLENINCALCNRSHKLSARSLLLFICIQRQSRNEMISTFENVTNRALYH